MAKKFTPKEGQEKVSVTLTKFEWECILYAVHTGTMRYVKCFHTETNPNGKDFLDTKINNCIPILRMLHRLTGVPQKNIGRRSLKPDWKIPPVFGGENTYEFDDAVEKFGDSDDRSNDEYGE